jgi:hypothetical protein
LIGWRRGFWSTLRLSNRTFPSRIDLMFAPP